MEKIELIQKSSITIPSAKFAFLARPFGKNRTYVDMIESFVKVIEVVYER